MTGNQSEFERVGSDGVKTSWPPCGRCGLGIRHRLHTAATGHPYRVPDGEAYAPVLP